MPVATQKQQEWIQAKQRIKEKKLTKHVIHPSNNCWRRVCQDICLPGVDTTSTKPRRWHWLHNNFDNIIMGLVIVNTIVMCFYHDPMSPSWSTVLQALNDALLICFVIEMILKHFALGFWKYWKSGWNAFDGIIVIGSCAASALTLFDVRIPAATQVWRRAAFPPFLSLRQPPLLPSIPCHVQIARIFRIGRILRLVKSAKQLRMLFKTVYAALPSMANVTALLLLMLFVGAVIAMELFGSSTYLEDEDPGLSRHANFASFDVAYLTLFRTLTGENVQVRAALQGSNGFLLPSR